MIVRVIAQTGDRVSLMLDRNGQKLTALLTKSEAENVCDMLRDGLRSDPPYGVNLLVQASQSDAGAKP